MARRIIENLGNGVFVVEGKIDMSKQNEPEKKQILDKDGKPMGETTTMGSGSLTPSALRTELSAPIPPSGGSGTKPHPLTLADTIVRPHRLPALIALPDGLNWLDPSLIIRLSIVADAQETSAARVVVYYGDTVQYERRFELPASSKAEAMRLVQDIVEKVNG